MKKFASERRPRLRDGGLQEALIPEPGSASVDVELGRVDLEDVVHLEEQRLVRAHFASFRNVSS